MAVDVAPPAHHLADGATPAFFPISSSTLVPASAAAICIAYAVPTLSYYATFASSLVCFAGAVWPDRVDAALAYARHAASRARADLEADLRRLRDAAARSSRPVLTAAVHGCARIVAGWAGRARRTWDEHRDAACAARFVLRLVALVARLAATVLFDAACDEARACAPSVLGYLRRVLDGIRPPSSSYKGVDGEAAIDGFVLKDIMCLVGTGFYLLFTMHLLFSSSAASWKHIGAVCFAAMCGLTMVIADRIDPPEDDDVEETDDTTAGTDDDSRDEELEVRESWRFLWLLVLITYCVDAFLLHVTLGPRPTTLAILALCNFEVLKVGRQVHQLTPEDGDYGAVDRWRHGAMVVFAACSVKILVVYLVLDCYLAALGFLWLFVMADLLLAEEDNLADFDAPSGEDDDEDEEESAAGFKGDITRGAEGELDDEEEAYRKEHSITSSSSSEDEDESCAHYGDRDSSSEDEDESIACCDRDSSSEDEEESPAQCDDSSEQHDEIIDHEEQREHDEVVDEEQGHEEPDYGSGGSSDGSWDLVDADDPEMPAKANCSANRKSRRLFPWKHAA